MTTTQTTRKRILIKRTDRGYPATSEGDEEVYRLFGTYTPATAFPAAADQGEVLQAIRDMNPECEVLLLCATCSRTDAMMQCGNCKALYCGHCEYRHHCSTQGENQ